MPWGSMGCMGRHGMMRRNEICMGRHGITRGGTGCHGLPCARGVGAREPLSVDDCCVVNHRTGTMGSSQSTTVDSTTVDYSKCIDDAHPLTIDQKIATVRNRMAQMMIKDSASFIIGKASGGGGPEARWTDRYVSWFMDIDCPPPPMSKYSRRTPQRRKGVSVLCLTCISCFQCQICVTFDFHVQCLFVI